MVRSWSRVVVKVNPSPAKSSISLVLLNVRFLPSSNLDKIRKGWILVVVSIPQLS